MHRFKPVHSYWGSIAAETNGKSNLCAECVEFIIVDAAELTEQNASSGENGPSPPTQRNVCAHAGDPAVAALLGSVQNTDVR